MVLCCSWFLNLQLKILCIMCILDHTMYLRNAAGFTPSIALYSPWVAFAISGLECFMRYNNILIPDQIMFDQMIFSLTSRGLTIKNFGIPEVLWLWSLITCSPFFLQTSNRYSWSQAFFFSCENLILQDRWSCSPSTTLSTKTFSQSSLTASFISSSFPTIEISSTHNATYIISFALCFI